MYVSIKPVVHKYGSAPINSATAGMNTHELLKSYIPSLVSEVNFQRNTMVTLSNGPSELQLTPLRRCMNVLVHVYVVSMSVLGWIKRALKCVWAGQDRSVGDNPQMGH